MAAFDYRITTLPRRNSFKASALVQSFNLKGLIKFLCMNQRVKNKHSQINL